MPTGINKIVDNINAKTAAGGLTELQIAQLNGAVTSIGVGDVISVANCTVLPCASLNTGRMIYVESLSAYRYSDGTNWTNCYDSTLKFACQLWVWGDGLYGALGDGTLVSKCSPVREISSSGNWRNVSQSFAHSAGVKADGSIWSWGRNNNVQLGNGSNVNTCSPVREFCSATNWCDLSVGYFHTTAIKTDGSIWAWGAGSYGRLGDGAAANRCSPVREVCLATNWCRVSSGRSHNLALKTVGELWVWGEGSYGSLGIGNTQARCSPVREICNATDWCAISAGKERNSFAIKTNGTMWGWGKGNLSSTWQPLSCSPVQETSLSTTWRSVNSGAYQSTAIKTDGSLWTWGYQGNYGALGNGSLVSTGSPVREFCSATNWCDSAAGLFEQVGAIKTDGTLWTWGRAICGQLASGTTANGRCSPVQEFCSATNWTRLSFGSNRGAGLRAVQCAGF